MVIYFWLFIIMFSIINVEFICKALWTKASAKFNKHKHKHKY